MSAEQPMYGEPLGAHYASGRLPAPMRLLIDAHAEINPAAKANVDQAEAVAAALLLNETPAAMRDDALQRALDAVLALETPQPAADDALADDLDALPEAVREAVRAAPGAQWKFASPGIKIMTLLRDGPAKAELLRISPGAGAPTHTHDGVELTLVLKGAFRAGDALFRSGEVCVAGPDDTHRPIAEPGAICIALAVTDAPLRFTGVLGALQKLFGQS